MRRADRLFQIVEHLRSRRLTTAQWLAEKLEVSTRTVYRDIADLQNSGVAIDGEAGVGYRIKHYDLAPLMFSSDELEALLSGIQIAKAWMDEELSSSADSALAKIERIVPAALKTQIHSQTIIAPDFHVPNKLRKPMSLLRKAIAHQRKVSIDYEDATGVRSQRVINPLGLVFWGQTWTLVAWCNLRSDFRSFRLDRFETFEMLFEKFESRTGQTLKDFIERHKDE